MYAEIPDPEESLEALLEGPEPDWEAPPEPPPNEDAADALLLRLGRVEREIARVEEAAASRFAQIQEWLERERFTLNRRRAWIEGSLETYMAAVAARSNVSTLSLPSGELHARRAPARWEFDEPTFLAWAAENLPAAIRQKPAPAPEIDRVEAKRLLTRKDQQGRTLERGVTEDYERPPGLLVVPGERVYRAIPRTES